MASEKPPVSFIGLGAMGFGMATNLIREGYAVTGFDMYGPTCERFRQAGGMTATTAAETVSGKDFCVCMVASAPQAQSVLFEGENPAALALPKGATLLLCSTVPCAYVKGLQRELVEKGRDDIALIDCPVSGGTGRAADGTLSIMAGASDEAIEKGRHLLQTMSDPAKLYIVKGGIGAGSNMKMCHQVLAANQVTSACEAMGFASHLGLDLPKTSDALLKSEGWSWMFENRLPRMLHPEFQPVASAMTIIIKDVSIITLEARRGGFSTPMTSIVEQLCFQALGRGWGPDDDSSLVRLFSEGKGKMGPVQGAVESEEAKLALLVNLLKGIHVCSAVESLTFAHHVGLDLDQVFELCINAAGGSRMLSAVGQEVMNALREGKTSTSWASKEGEDSLQSLARNLEEAIDEGQRLKVPLFLGSQALNCIRLAIKAGAGQSSELAAASIIRVWGS
jgi:3-hydroxyisobutyrate dehydrogenase